MTFSAKQLPDRRVMINLGCGTRMCPAWNNIDFSTYARLRRHRIAVKLLHSAGLISPARYAQFAQVDPDIVVWDLKKGIPFDDATFDCVYHSHLLEHIDLETVPVFLRECLRVLKPQRILRIVVPDLETWARRYVASLNDGDPSHGEIVAKLLDQLVRREPVTRQFQKPIVRLLERVILGDAISTGYQHRWMWDFRTLSATLEQTGFVDVRRENSLTSRVAGWSSFGLDANPDGSDHKPGSLYCEAMRPL